MPETKRTRIDWDGLREAFEERAAILEYDAGMCRADAEATARRLVYGRRNTAPEKTGSRPPRLTSETIEGMSPTVECRQPPAPIARKRIGSWNLSRPGRDWIE